ncbi:response regulator [Paenibacillus glycinis]|uniref:Response regulator n=1 Tax=Paenibacillus glycinis TaxID=2697035 RepID=A0ABW9XTW7_9BACL|nr:response regulator [Paenibacillus glycinis]NBD25767.1 response regulator [Paenibacillus glycinis]
MLKLIIADDELPVREAFSRLIDWSSNGIELCATAAHGAEALELIERHRPELLLTDIKMPNLDGLQLMEEMQARGYFATTLLLSGYNDFHLVQKALKLGAFDYILKPCHPLDVLKAVLQAKEAALAAMDRKKENDDWENQWRQNVSLAKTQLLGDWLHRAESPWENRVDRARTLGIQLPETGLNLAIIRLEFKNNASYGHAAHDRELIRYAALNIVKETMDGFGASYETFRDKEDMIVIWHESSGSRQTIRAKLERLQHHILVYLKITATIGCSDRPGSLHVLNIEYGQARHALDLSFFQGPGGIYFYADHLKAEEREAAEQSLRLEELERLFFDKLKGGQYSEVIDCLDQWFTGFKGILVPNRSEFHIQTLSLMSRLLQEAEASSADGTGYDRLVRLADEMLKAETVDELFAVTTQMIQKLVESRNAHKSIHRTIARAVELIKERYASNLTLKAVAEEVYLSPSYLSTLFKQEMGIKYIDYLHQYRIEVAKTLLGDGKQKVSSVAMQVGYFDEAHFIHTFKKWTGSSPAAYARYGGETRPGAPS